MSIFLSRKAVPQIPPLPRWFSPSHWWYAVLLGLHLIKIEEFLDKKDHYPRSWCVIEEARRRGWKVYAPEIIDRYRDQASTFVNLMREVGATSVRLDDRPNACIRSLRNNKCLVFVVDGLPVGPYIWVSPRDVYFFAVLSATESAVQWGDKAPFGAIVVYTRMYGDKKRP